MPILGEILCAIDPTVTQNNHHVKQKNLYIICIMGFQDLVKLQLRQFEEPRFDASLSGVALMTLPAQKAVIIFLTANLLT